MSLSPPPHDNDPIITQFKPLRGQWELNDDNIKRIDPQTGETILHNYCQRINLTALELFRFLIETKSCGVNVQDKNGDTPLHHAIRQFYPTHAGNIIVLTYLLNQKGVDFNLKGRGGYTLLHLACENIDALPMDIFQLLIETKGCDVNAHNNDNKIPLCYALQFFDSNRDDITVLMYLLNQKDVNVDIKGEYGYTLLHLACENINRLPMSVFQNLIKTMGCDVNARSDDDDTPINLALRQFHSDLGGNITVLIYLLNQKGVHANVTNRFNHTSLHIACDNINNLPLDIFKLLIETHGCDINAWDNNNDTPLHLAFGYFKQGYGGDIAVLMYLLTQNSINFNIMDKKGRNLLHLACICDISDSWDSVDLYAERDAMLCPIVETIAERCVQLILDETKF
jgi:ankyrin repeat protein